MNMIERVAQAMADADDIPGTTHYEGMARAAIEAMREPTKAMLDAGWEAPADVGLDGLLSESMRSSWCAMIDAALNHPEK